MRPHRRQPTRLPRPWDSPGKNAGVGCHFLLHCVKVKSESEVAQSPPTSSDPMDCSLPGSSIHGIFQARALALSKPFSVLNSDVLVSLASLCHAHVDLHFSNNYQLRVLNVTQFWHCLPGDSVTSHKLKVQSHQTAHPLPAPPPPLLPVRSPFCHHLCSDRGYKWHVPTAQWFTEVKQCTTGLPVYYKRKHLRNNQMEEIHRADI